MPSAFRSPLIDPFTSDQIQMVSEIGMEFEQGLQVPAGFVFIAVPASGKAFFDGAIPHHAMLSLPTASLPADGLAFQPAYGLKNADKAVIIFEYCIGLRPVGLAGF